MRPAFLMCFTIFFLAFIVNARKKHRHSRTKEASPFQMSFARTLAMEHEEREDTLFDEDHRSYDLHLEMTIMSLCSFEHGLTDTDVKTIYQGDFTRLSLSPKSQCAIQCYMSVLGLMDEKNDFEPNKFADIYGKIAPQYIVNRTFEACRYMGGEDDCTKAYDIGPCMYKASQARIRQRVVENNRKRFIDSQGYLDVQDSKGKLEINQIKGILLNSNGEVNEDTIKSVFNEIGHALGMNLQGNGTAQAVDSAELENLEEIENAISSN